MAHDEPQLSFSCEREHAACGHKFGVAVNLFRPSKVYALLCSCNCHDSCPLGCRTKVPEQLWADACTCPGSTAWREVDGAARAELERQAAQHDEVLRSFASGGGRSAAEIRQMIRDGYAGTRLGAASDFGGVSRFAAAGTARRGRGTRLLLETVRALRTAKGHLRASARNDAPADDNPQKRD